jgi:membrane protein DedA with SNARE-associated domain
MTLGMAAGSAVLAALVGDQVWFELGRRGRQVLNWLCRISFEPTSRVRRTESSLPVTECAHWLSRNLSPASAQLHLRLPGLWGLRRSTFTTAGTLLWVGSGIGLGYLFSDQLEQVLSMTFTGVLQRLIGSLVGLVKRL